jgi:hypothetical protein
MGKQFLPKKDFPFKSYDKKLVFLQRMGNFFPYRAQGKKAFFSQSMWSTFAKTFCTCSPSSLGQDLMVKNEIFYFYFSFGLLELEMAVLRCSLREKTFVF